MKTITGQWSHVDGTPAANCTLYLTLSQDATAAGTAQIAPNVLAITLTANGQIPANTQIWANDELSPVNTVYIATLNDTGGGRLWGPEFLPITGVSPINLNNIVPIASSPSISILVSTVNTGNFNRLLAGLGTSLVSADFALSGWGSGASLSSIIGTDSAFQLTVTAGTGPSANPTLTLTFHDGPWQQPPMSLCEMTSGTGANTELTNTTSTTQLVITFLGTPVPSDTYTITALSIGPVSGGTVPTVNPIISVNSAGLTAAVNSTVLFAVPSTQTGVYRLVSSVVTTATGTGSVNVGAVYNNGSATVTLTGSSASLSVLGAEATNIFDFYSTGSQNITYSTTFTGSGTYTLRLRLEYLG